MFKKVAIATGLFHLLATSAFASTAATSSLMSTTR
jgi:hypothetical protein